MYTFIPNGYMVFINDVLLPVTPGKLTIKINGKNKTYTLASGEELNALNPVGLTDYEFDVLLPAHDGYSFAHYVDGFISPAWFLAFFADIMASQKPCTLRIVRTLPINRSLTSNTLINIPYNQSVRVSIENYTIKEDASNGRDITVTIKLRKYVDYGTKIVRVLGDGEDTTAIVSETTRETDNAPSAENYTVKKGDSLWAITKKYTGNGARYSELMEANGLTSTTIYAGQVLKIPW